MDRVDGVGICMRRTLSKGYPCQAKEALAFKSRSRCNTPVYRPEEFQSIWRAATVANTGLFCVQPDVVSEYNKISTFVTLFANDNGTCADISFGG